MIRKTIVVLTLVAILMGATAAALVAQAFKPTGSAHVYNELINRPSYMKGKMLEGCHEHPVECSLVGW